MSASDTPKTDKVTATIFSHSGFTMETVDADFARELERENNRLKRQLEEAIAALMKIDARSPYPTHAGVALDRIKQLSENTQSNK